MKVLVAYGSKAGSTAEVARAIGDVLSSAGAEADVLDVKTVKDIQPYDCVVLGSAVRMGKVLSPVVKFAEKYNERLLQIPVAYFLVCMAMTDCTPENRQEAEGYLQPLVLVKKPDKVGLFAGKLEPAELGPVLRAFFSRDKEGKFPVGDHRDWEAIRSWAGELAELLLGD